MSMTAAWTGRTACALQDAMRLSNERFAACLGIGVRTVAAWHQKPTMRPKSELQQILDTALEQAPEPVKERFARLVGGSTSAIADQGETADAERRLTTDPNVSAALEWLDHCSAWAPGTARRHVASRLVQLDVRALHDRGAHRGRVDQRRIARALGEYYGAPDEPYGRYGARCDGQKINTSVLTCSDWLDLDAPLAGHRQRLTLASATDPDVRLDDDTAGHAVQRLAETLALGIRLVDMPLYRLNVMNIGKGAVAGSVAVTRFVRYALTSPGVVASARPPNAAPAETHIFAI